MKLWGRQRIQNTHPGPIMDLDAIVAEPVHFRFKGKTHTLKPIELQAFLKFTNAQSSLTKNISPDSAVMTPLELAKKYHAVINSICDTISVDDIMSMEQVQVAALYQLVIDMVTGQVDLGDDSKKKRQKIPLYDIVRGLSSQNAPANSDGQ